MRAAIAVVVLLVENIRLRYREWQGRREEAARGTELVVARLEALSRRSTRCR